MELRQAHFTWDTHMTYINVYVYSIAHIKFNVAKLASVYNSQPGCRARTNAHNARRIIETCNTLSGHLCALGDSPNGNRHYGSSQGAVCHYCTMHIYAIHIRCNADKASGQKKKGINEKCAHTESKNKWPHSLMVRKNAAHIYLYCAVYTIRELHARLENTSATISWIPSFSLAIHSSSIFGGADQPNETQKSRSSKNRRLKMAQISGHHYRQLVVLYSIVQYVTER